LVFVEAAPLPNQADGPSTKLPQLVRLMKTLQSLFVAGLVLATSFAARAESSAQAWLETYYVNPRPTELTANVRALSREGFFEKSGNTALGIGFLATVFAQNPTKVDRWLVELNGVSDKTHRLIIAALWQAGHPLGSELLRVVGQDSVVRNAVLKLSATPAQLITDTPVRSSSSMNLQWGAFLASGEERHITRIFDALGTGERSLDDAARVSLAHNAAAHPRVLELCRANLDRQPEEVRSVLRAALRDVESKPRI
jgi:hypothetical protein